MTNSSNKSKKSHTDFFDQCDQLLEKIETSLQENIKNINELEKIKSDLENTQKSNMIVVMRNWLSQKSFQETIKKLENARQDIIKLRKNMKEEVSKEEDKLLRKLEQERR